MRRDDLDEHFGKLRAMDRELATRVEATRPYGRIYLNPVSPDHEGWKKRFLSWVQKKRTSHDKSKSGS